MAMIRVAEDYFARGCGRCARFASPACSARLWAEGLAQLRALCRCVGLEETAKWGHPIYTHAGRNIALLGAFRESFTLSFMNAELLEGMEGHLQPAGPHSRVPSLLRFTAAEEVEAKAETIRRALDQLIRHAAAGTRPAKAAARVELPPELEAALEADPALAAAFVALSPGRRRGYALRLARARQAETRQRLIEGFRAQILAGKGLTDR